jgi:hypothetical protein
MATNSPGSQAKDRQANATRNSRTGAPGNANRDSGRTSKNDAASRAEAAKKKGQEENGPTTNPITGEKISADEHKDLNKRDQHRSTMTKSDREEADRAFVSQTKDAENRVGDETIFDDFWNGVANFVGLREQAPEVVGEDNSMHADWGVDSAGVLGGLVGGAFLPGLGLLTGPMASELNDQFGNPIPDVNLGKLGSPDDKADFDPVSGDVSGGDTDTADPGNPSSTGGDRTAASDVADNIEDPTGTGQAAPDLRSTKPTLPEDEEDTILPTSGIGISIPTQTSGSGSSVNVGTPEQRRRRGTQTLGGLGRSGLAL